MVNGICNCCCDACETDFSHTACSDLIQVVVGIVEESYIDIRAVGMNRDYVVGEIAVHRRPAPLVVLGSFEHGHADAHHHCAFDLIAGSTGINDATGVNHCDHTTDAEARHLGLPHDFCELGTVAVRGHLVCAQCAL